MAGEGTKMLQRDLTLNSEMGCVAFADADFSYLSINGEAAEFCQSLEHLSEERRKR